MRKKTHSIDVLFGFALFGLFTILSLMLVLIGANVFNSVVRASDSNNEIRASIAYVTNKVRSEDSQDSIRVEQRDGIEALVIGQKIEGRQYETLIYYYDGSLRELLHRPNQTFHPNLGQQLAELSGFSVTQSEQGNLLTIQVETTGGREYTSQVALRS